MLKAAAGGGGRGMKVVFNSSDLPEIDGGRNRNSNLAAAL